MDIQEKFNEFQAALKNLGVAPGWTLRMIESPDLMSIMLKLTRGGGAGSGHSFMLGVTRTDLDGPRNALLQRVSRWLQDNRAFEAPWVEPSQVPPWSEHLAYHIGDMVRFSNRMFAAVHQNSSCRPTTSPDFLKDMGYVPTPAPKPKLDVSNFHEEEYSPYKDEFVRTPKHTVRAPSPPKPDPIKPIDRGARYIDLDE